MHGLCVMTYNIGRLRGRDGRVNDEQVAAVITAGTPAVVALQGCPDDRQLLERLASRVGMQLYSAAGDGAFLSDLPLRALRCFDLGQGGWCLRADADYAGRRLHLFNVRLTDDRQARDSQQQALLGPELFGHPDLATGCLILGELPGWLWRLRCSRLLFPVTRPCWSPTFPAHWPWRRIARAYHGQGLKTGTGRVLKTEVARRASPHLPFLFTVQSTDQLTYLKLERDKPFRRRGQMEIAPG